MRIGAHALVEAFCILFFGSLVGLSNVVYPIFRLLKSFCDHSVVRVDCCGTEILFSQVSTEWGRGSYRKRIYVGTRE